MCVHEKRGGNSMNFKLILIPQPQFYEILRNEAFSEEVRQMKLIAFSFYYVTSAKKTHCRQKNASMI